MEALQIFEAPETFAYIEHEVTCPFCEGTMLSVVPEEGGTYYRCGDCENDWTVLGEAA